MKKLVSIIITCYNYEQYIEECLKSCINQTYPEIEIIVVDDCSTDNSSKIINEVMEKSGLEDEKWSNYYNHKNMGYSYSKNRGIQEAKGDYITFIDADDCLVPESVELRMAEVEKNPELDFVHGIALRWYGGKKFKGYDKKNYCHSQGRLYKKELHRKFGLYYEGLRAKADKEWIFRIGLHPESPLPKVVKDKKIKKVCAWYLKHKLAMHKKRRKNPKYNAKIKKEFKRRIRQLKKEGITRDNTDFL